MTGRTFSYARAVAPMVWVFVALPSIELVVAHFLLALWRPRIAIFVSLTTLLFVGWLVSVIRSFARLPVTLDGQLLVVRVGRLRRINVPVSSIAGLRGSWSAEWLKDRSVVNLALIAYPNVVVMLKPPILTTKGRAIVAVAHRLDDPAGFADAIEALGHTDG